VHKPWEQMRRCVLNSDGTVNYYLNAFDSTLKADGTAADLTGADGNVMVEIPKFWFKTVYSGTRREWYVRTAPAGGYSIHPAFIKNGVEVDFRYDSAYDACLNFSRSITAVADAGGGDITVTTAAQHPLYTGDTVTISGTTSYDGTYTVVSRASNTTFTVTAAFVATETGTASGYVSGKNLDDMTANIDFTTDKLASVAGVHPLVGITRDEARTLAANNGTGWRQLDFWLVQAIQMLYLVEYGDFNSQSTLGAGNTNDSYVASSAVQTDSPHTIAGASDAFGNASTDGTQPSAGAKPGTAYMSYRGVENFFGNAWNWVDGFNINDRQAYVSNTDTDFADNTSTNYDEIGVPMPDTNNYITDIQDIEGAFLPASSVGGSSSTYLTDYYWQGTGWRVAPFGGSAANGAFEGAFCWYLYASGSSAGRFFAARVTY